MILKRMVSKTALPSVPAPEALYDTWHTRLGKTAGYVLFSPPSGCQSITAVLTESNWLKQIKTDWAWLRLTETDWKWQKTDRIGLKVDENLGKKNRWNRQKLASAISHGRWGKNT